MKQPAAAHALFLASMAFACSAFASNDVNKCVAPSGMVTLTDEPCPGGTQTVKVISGPAESSDADIAPTQATVMPERFTVGRLPPRYVTLTKGSKPQRGLALDVATLRAAKLNMHLLDNAAQVLRSQRLAGLQ